jgi:hypothetical protein
MCLVHDKVQDNEFLENPMRLRFAILYSASGGKNSPAIEFHQSCVRLGQQNLGHSTSLVSDCECHRFTESQGRFSGFDTQNYLGWPKAAYPHVCLLSNDRLLVSTGYHGQLLRPLAEGKVR